MKKIGILALMMALILLIQPQALLAYYSNSGNYTYEEENISMAAERSPGEYIDVLVSVAQKGTTDFDILQIYLDYDPNVLEFIGISPIILRSILNEEQQLIYDDIGSEAFGEAFPNLLGSNHNYLEVSLYYYESTSGRVSLTWTTNGEYTTLCTALFVIVRYSILEGALYGVTRITPNHLSPVLLNVVPDEINIKPNPLINRPSLPALEPSSAGEELFRDWYLYGHRDGTIRPHGRMTRAEVLQAFFNISESPLKYQNDGVSNFEDVSPSAWYFNAISYFERAGKVSGFADGSFRPQQLMTKAEFIFFAIRFFGIENNYADFELEQLVIENHWAAHYINKGFGGGWLDYFDIADSFNPDTPITRAQSIALVNFYLGRTPNVDAIRTYLDGNVIWPDLQAGHWSFYEIVEASIARTYSFDESGTEFWINAVNVDEILARRYS